GRPARSVHRHRRGAGLVHDRRPRRGGRQLMDLVKRIGLGLAAPLLALVIAFIVSSFFLVLADVNPFDAFSSMWSYGTRSDSLISMVNRATPLYISALAVGIGFQMGLFNIGVEGQYRVAAVFAAAVGA